MNNYYNGKGIWPPPPFFEMPLGSGIGSTGDGKGAWKDRDALVLHKSLGLGKWAPKGKN